MSAKPMLVLGIMSGTSADGVECALARISGAPPHVQGTLLNHCSVNFSTAVKKEILRVAEQSSISAGELSQLNFKLGEVFADAALTACKKFRVSPARISLIGCHGQTIFHQGPPVPFLGSKTASTLQIGEAAIIAARTGITTVADFRPADMAAGGQGAPLVPYADYLLYAHPRIGRVSLNLGGIANVTVLAAGARADQITAFDTGPANMLIDALVSHFTNGRQSFDKDAELAQSGRSIPALINELMRDPYLKMPPPKSTGREYYGGVYLKKLLALGIKHKAHAADLVRATTIFTALSVVDALNRFVLAKTKIQQLIVSGGGAKNPLLMAQLTAALSGIEVLLSQHFGVPVDAKEAFAFALLAYETFHRRASNVPAATGARRAAILGKISYAPPR